MLKLLNGADNPVLNIDDFYIDELWSGLDELVFDIPVEDPAYKAILEEAVIEYEQPYLVKAIDAGKTQAKIKCQLNLDALKADMRVPYANDSDTVAGTIEGVLPSGWTVVDHSYINNRRTIKLDAGTPLDVIQECASTYSVVIRYDVKHKQVHIWDPDAFVPLGAFASRDLNLKEVNYKGKSSSFATRLYGYGKDGMSVASINDGSPYVEDHTYSDKVISVYWKDERYTIVENLLADMKKKLKELAVPEISYSCDVLDLAKTNPELYGHQNFALMQVIRLVDDIKGITINHQIVQYRRYPFYPEKNVVTLSTVAPKIMSTVKQLEYNQDNPSSPFRRQMQAAIDNATTRISLAEKGYVVLPKDADGNVTELLIMDKPNKETATKVWRWNMGGLGYSGNGYNGPYGTAITMDGAIVANYITVGTMSCDRIRGGTLILGGASNGNGTFYLRDAGNQNIAIMDNTGLKMFKGSINLADKFIVSSEGKLEATDATITGSITANTGYIGGTGGFVIAAGKLYSGGKTALGYNSDGVYLGVEGIALGQVENGVSMFEVDKAGTAVMRKAYVIGNGLLFEPGGGISTDYSSYAQFQVLSNGRDVMVNAVDGNLMLGPYNTYGVHCGATLYDENGREVKGTTASDRRLKRSIRRLDKEKAYDFILHLAPAEYRYRKNAVKKDFDRYHHGFIAQDLKDAMYADWAVVDEFVLPGKRKQKRYCLEYDELLADMVAAFQFLSERVDDLYGKTSNSCA